MPKLLIDFLPEELSELFVGMGLQKYRARQVYEWVMKGVDEFSGMKNLPKDLREKLADTPEITIGIPKIKKKLVSEIDGTRKYIMEFYDGNIIESVLMVYNHGITACISSQVGCRMGCAFCASEDAGFVRNLSGGEMLGQVIAMQNDAGERISGVVVMGVGEPLDNYEEFLRFIKLVNCPEGLNIGQRHITVSTCGIIPKIEALSDENLQITLAISLHSSDNSKRKEIMPVNRKYNIEDVLTACRNYIAKTKRRITFEYALIKGFNDSEADAAALAGLLKGLMCHVNLIPVNTVKGKDFRRSGIEIARAFESVLKRKGIETTVRRELGMDINAACGQLRKEQLGEQLTIKGRIVKVLKFIV